MNFVKKALFCFCLIFSIVITAQASHIIGGDISYKCLGNDKYEFTVKIYRDCYNGVPLIDAQGKFVFFKSSGVRYDSIITPWVSDTIIPPRSSNPCLVIPPTICVEEGVYIFTITLPRVEGGYTLTYQGCCRNASILNLNAPDATGATYFETLSDTVLSLCNNSPVFKNYPPIVVCVDRPLLFNNSATDADGDKLVYELCQPYTADGSTQYNQLNPGATKRTPPPYSNVNYKGGYSADDPMKGSPKLTIDPVTGFIKVTPDLTGQFVVGICVSEYRNGVFLGKHLRDFQFNVVTCKPEVDADFPSQTNSCHGDTIFFDNNSDSGIIYHWDFGVPGVDYDTSNLRYPWFIYTRIGIYNTQLIAHKAGSKCGDTAESKVYIYPPPYASEDTIIVIGTKAHIWATRGVKYKWTPSETLNNDSIATPTASPTVNTTYLVEITTPNGCTYVDTVIVRVVNSPIINFYNAFSPNGDGVNDFYRPLVTGIVNKVTFRIYNRWGQMVFETNDVTKPGWDGKFKGVAQPVGVYIYYFECQGNTDKIPYTKKGNITLLR